MARAQRTLTDVPGLAVGHAGDPAAATGCTVVLGPFRAAVDVRGLATGSRELDALSLTHLVPRADAVLLTGGSAFGLGATDGVMAWLEERGRGFDTGHATVPIVPSAVIYDLGVGDPAVRPDAEMGRAAAEDASRGPVLQGRVGAGTGATVGKLRGPEGAEPGGVGSWATSWRDRPVGALAVVNAFGDVLDGDGSILAGCRAPDGSFVDTDRALRDGESWPTFGPGEHTTLAVVATDLPLGRRELEIVARQAMNGVARRVSPSGTPVDGDMVFALSTGTGGEAARGTSLDAGALTGLGTAAREAVERAVAAAVRQGGEER